MTRSERLGEGGADVDLAKQTVLDLKSQALPQEQKEKVCAKLSRLADNAAGAGSLVQLGAVSAARLEASSLPFSLPLLLRRITHSPAGSTSLALAWVRSLPS